MSNRLEKWTINSEVIGYFEANSFEDAMDITDDQIDMVIQDYKDENPEWTREQCEDQAFEAIRKVKTEWKLED